MEHNGHTISEEERRAVEVHKWYLSQHAGRDVGWDAALEDWARTHQSSWRALHRRQHFVDNVAQAREIRDYVWIRSEQAGTDVSGEAVEEWVRLYAREWREKAERGPRKDEAELRQVMLDVEAHGCGEPACGEPESICCRTVTVRIEKGLHVRPSMELKKVIDRYRPCQVFVQNLAASDGGSIRVAEMMDLLQLGAICGDVLVFRAVGPEAEAALDAIEALLAELARLGY